MYSQAADETRNRIAQLMLAQQLAPAAEIFPHSPTSSFEMSPSDMPTGSLPEASLSTQTIDVFDPGGGLVAPNPGGSVPTPSNRDMFDNESVQDWGGVFSPAPTMTAPSPMFGMTEPFDDTGVPSDNAPVTPGYNMPEFNPDTGLPSAPAEQGASLTAPSGALGMVSLGDVVGIGDVAGLGDVGPGAGGLGAVGGTEGAAGIGDTSAGGVG